MYSTISTAVAVLMSFCFSLLKDAGSLIDRNPQNEVKLVILRFLGILLGYRKKDKHKDSKVGCMVCPVLY